MSSCFTVLPLRCDKIVRKKNLVVDIRAPTHPPKIRILCVTTELGSPPRMIITALNILMLIWELLICAEKEKNRFGYSQFASHLPAYTFVQ